MRVISMILAAGWPIWPLIVCSILALAIVIERALSLTDAKVAPPGLAQAVVEQARTHRHQVAELSIPDTRTLLGQVLASALEIAKRNPEFDTQDLQSAMHQAGRKAAQTLETRLQMLATIASAAPLLGLLGTVVGMIEIFGAQSGGGASSACHCCRPLLARAWASRTSKWVNPSVFSSGSNKPASRSQCNPLLGRKSSSENSWITSGRSCPLWLACSSCQK